MQRYWLPQLRITFTGVRTTTASADINASSLTRWHIPLAYEYLRSVDGPIMLPLIINMLRNIVTNTSLNFIVDVYSDVVCNVMSVIALNFSVGSILQVWTQPNEY